MVRCGGCGSRASPYSLKAYLHPDGTRVFVLCRECQPKYAYDRQYTPAGRPSGSRVDLTDRLRPPLDELLDDPPQEVLP